MRTTFRILREEGGDPTNPDNPGGGGGSNTPPARPDELPEEFWDAEKGVVKVDALVPKLKEYQSLTEGVIQKPEEVDWTLPNDLDPDNKDTVFEVNKDDPMVQAFAPLLVGLKKEKANELIVGMARYQLAELKQAREAIRAEEKKLGDKYMERIQGAQAFIEKALTSTGKNADDAKKIAEAFRNTWVTAQQVEVIEALAKYASGPQPARAENGAGQSEQNKGRVFYSGMGGAN